MERERVMVKVVGESGTHSDRWDSRDRCLGDGELGLFGRGGSSVLEDLTLLCYATDKDVFGLRVFL